MQTKIEMGIMGSRPKKVQPRTINSLQTFFSILDMKGLEPKLKEAVTKIAKTYPEGSLDYLYNNLDRVIMKCAEVLRTNGEIPVVPEVFSEVVAKIEPKTIEAVVPIVPRKSLFDENIKPKWTTAPKLEPVVEKPEIFAKKKTDLHPILGICTDGLEANEIADLLRTHFSIKPPRQGNEGKNDY